MEGRCGIAFQQKMIEKKFSFNEKTNAVIKEVKINIL